MSTSVSDDADYFPVLQLIANPTSSWWTDAEKRPKAFFRGYTLSVWLKSRYRHGNKRLRLSVKRGWTTHCSESTKGMSLLSVEVKDNRWENTGTRTENAPKTQLILFQPVHLIFYFCVCSSFKIKLHTHNCIELLWIIEQQPHTMKHWSPLKIHTFIYSDGQGRFCVH